MAPIALIIHRLTHVALALCLCALILPALPTTLVRAAGVTYYVGTLGDDGGTTTANCAVATNPDCTLRDALAVATSGMDTIVFVPTQGVVTLTNGTLVLADTVTITGPGMNHIAVDGGMNASAGNIGVRVFLVNTGVTATISGLTVQHGNALDSGGGIKNNGALILTNDIFVANNAPVNGGGIITYGGTLTMLNDVVTRNTTGNSGGGGLVVSSGTATITNTTFSGNTASGGGANIISQAPLTLVNSTIVGTTVNSGIIAVANTITLANSILTGPAGSTNCAANAATEIVDGGHNVQFPGTSCGATITVADPMLDLSLRDNGGPGPTHALLPGSPAIDVVPLMGAGCPATDARGLRRPQGTACDSGAYESRGFTLVATSGDGQSAPAFSGAFPQPLVATITSVTGELVNGGQITFTSNGGQGASFDIGNPGTCAITSNRVTAVCPIVGGNATSPPLFAQFAPATVNVTASASGANASGATVARFSETTTPTLTRISPASGDVKGGGVVTITGGGFTPGVTTVTFGTGASAATVPVGALATGSFGFSITFTAPAHAAGVMDVTVTVNGISTTKAGAYTYGVVNAQPSPEPTRAVMGTPHATPPPHAAAPTPPASTPTPLSQPTRH